MKKKMLAVAVCVSMCMMAFAGCTSESGGGSDKKAEQTEGKKEESGKVFMTVSNQQNEFMVGMAENFKEVGEAAGYEVQLMDADLDATKHKPMRCMKSLPSFAQSALVMPALSSTEGLTSNRRQLFLSAARSERTAPRLFPVRHLFLPRIPSDTFPSAPRHEKRESSLPDRKSVV